MLTQRGVDLSDANLSGAELATLELTEPTFSGADLSDTNLSEATVNDEQLDTVWLLEGATMPYSSAPRLTIRLGTSSRGIGDSSSSSAPPLAYCVTFSPKFMSASCLLRVTTQAALLFGMSPSTASIVFTSESFE